MRGTNAIDFWRGTALVMIFINHVPGNAIAYWTLRNFAVVDAAELFVFLAGWSLFIATGGAGRKDTSSRVAFRLITRSIELYRAHLVISVLALAMSAAMALLHNNPLYLDWNNAGPAFSDAPRAYIGLVLLTFQLGYFNILPLYIVLLVMMVGLILIARYSLAAALTLSLALYVVALWTRMIPPAWPAYERWYFNPLAWQFLMMLGYAAARVSATSATFLIVLPRLTVPSIVVLLIGLILTRYQLFPDPIVVPEPRMFFLFDKTYLSPARLISLAALVIAFRSVWQPLDAGLPGTSSYLCALGRNSLAVFCVGSLLSLLGQFVRFTIEESISLDLLIVVVGLAAMGFTAWFVEWRQRLPSGSSRSSQS